MMSVPVRVLLQNLLDKTEYVITEASKFEYLTLDQLRQAPASGGWSIGECLIHLNMYGAYYLPQLQQALSESNLWTTLNTTFKSGIVGNYMANSMLPESGKFRKMKSPYNKRPKVNEMPYEIRSLFIEQQLVYKNILQQADQYNLNKRLIHISIAPFFKISLGDTLRFCVHHNIRHMQQAMRVYEEITK
jgi:uncharacterized damage-inducible protein DinB